LSAVALTFATGAAGGTGPGKKAPPANTTLSAISGTAQTGKAMTATTGTWSGQTSGFAFQWLRCDSAGAACASIPGQTASTHLIAASEAGSTLTRGRDCIEQERQRACDFRGHRPHHRSGSPAATTSLDPAERALRLCGGRNIQI